jgi:hypothetical protein
MNVLDLISKTILGAVGYRPQPQPVYQPVPNATQQQYRQPQPHYTPPQPKTPLQELIELNPMFAGMNLSEEQAKVHLSIESRNYQNNIEKINGIRTAAVEREAKKQRLQMVASAMETQFVQEQARKQQYQAELASLEQKYNINQQPVRFS